MGILDDIGRGLADVGRQALGSALGTVAQIGINKLFGTASSSGAPAGFPQGGQRRIPSTGPFVQQQPQFPLTNFGFPQQPFFQGPQGLQVRPPSQAFPTQPISPQFFPQPQPSSQAGFIPVGGGNVPAFPTQRFQGFPPSPAQNALFTPVAGGIPQLFDLPFIDVVPQGGASGLAAAGAGTPPFRRTMAGARAQFFRSPNPITGQDTWFRPAGRPILWSGDLTSCKRVNKVARRARRKR